LAGDLYNCAQATPRGNWLAYKLTKKIRAWTEARNWPGNFGGFVYSNAKREGDVLWPEKEHLLHQLPLKQKSRREQLEDAIFLPSFPRSKLTRPHIQLNKILLAVEDEAEFPVVSQDDCFGCKIPSVYLTLSGSLELMAEPGIPHDDKVQRIRSVADEKFPCMIQPRKLKCLSAG
jgi:hypothetical protein